MATAEPGPGPPHAAAADAASRLLRRPPPPGYLEAWAERVRRPPEDDRARRRVSYGTFRLGPEWFALRTEHVVEVRLPARVRPVPGRTGGVFLGLVSLRGVVHLCASLHALLGLEEPAPTPAARLLLLERDGDAWAARVDEVGGFERVDEGAAREAQVTVAKAAVRFTDAVLDTPRGPAARIDPERLFEGLARSLA